MFMKAAMALDRAVDAAKSDKPDELQSWACVQAEGQHKVYNEEQLQYPLLTSIIDPQEALS